MSDDDGQRPGGLTFDTAPYTLDEVKAGDFPADAEATGTRVEPDGRIYTFTAKLADVRAMMTGGAALPFSSHHVPAGKLPNVLHDATEAGASRQGLRTGGSSGGTKGSETKRRRQKRLRADVLRLQGRGKKPGEIIDALLPRSGIEYEPHDGDAYEDAREALRKRIERAMKKRKPDV